MSIGTDVANVFNSHVSTATCKIGEIYLFRQLIKAITTVGFSAHYTKSAEIHGPRSFVEFVSSGSCGLPSRGIVKRRELADILFLTYSPRNHKCRVTFMQNKFQKNNDRTKIKRTDLFQFELLSQRPLLTFAPKFIPNNLLHDALIPSIGSYGLFVFDSENKQYDMVYYSADELCLHTPVGVSSTRQTDFNNSFNKTRTHRGIEDINATETLETFINYLVGYKIGEPIDSDTLANLKYYLRTLGVPLPKDFEILFLDTEDSDRIASDKPEDLSLERSELSISKAVVFVNTDIVKE